MPKYIFFALVVVAIVRYPFYLCMCVCLFMHVCMRTFVTYVRTCLVYNNMILYYNMLCFKWFDWGSIMLSTGLLYAFFLLYVIIMTMFILFFLCGVYILWILGYGMCRNTTEFFFNIYILKAEKKKRFMGCIYNCMIMICSWCIYNTFG